MKEAIKDRLAFLKYGSMLLMMFAALLLYLLLGYSVVSYAYSQGGEVAGLIMSGTLILLSIALGRRISSL